MKPTGTRAYSDAMRIRIVVANIQSGIGVTKGYRQYLTSSWRYVLPHPGHGAYDAGVFLKEESVDITLLTEVDAGSKRSRGISQLETMSREASLSHMQFFPTRSVGSSINEGSAILARYPIAATRSHALSSNVHPRVLGETVLAIEASPVTVLVAHLALNAKAREVQIAEIAKRVQQVEGPVILGGDFNERNHRAFKHLKASGLTPISVPGYPSWKPLHSLQVLFLSSHFPDTTVSVPSSKAFSDHLPLIIETELA